MDREKFDRDVQGVNLALDEIKSILAQRIEARRTRAGLMVRERPPDHAPLSLDERLERFQAETREFQAETRVAFAEIRRDALELRQALEDVQQQMATKAELATLREATIAEIAALRGQMATKTEIAALREQMATKADIVSLKAQVESVRDDVRKVAEGFAATQNQLHNVAGLLRRHVVEG